MILSSTSCSSSNRASAMICTSPPLMPTSFIYYCFYTEINYTNKQYGTNLIW